MESGFRVGIANTKSLDTLRSSSLTTHRDARNNDHARRGDRKVVINSGFFSKKLLSWQHACV